MIYYVVPFISCSSIFIVVADLVVSHPVPLTSYTSCIVYKHAFMTVFVSSCVELYH